VTVPATFRPEKHPAGSPLATTAAGARETPAVPNPPPPVAVANGMRSLLARRTETLEGGATAVGWKIGFNTKGIQDHFGISGPVVGFLTDRTLLTAGEDIRISEWLRPALEVEVAIRVGPDGGVAALAPALELVDLDQPFDRIEPILAQNIFHRGVVFGPERVGVAVDDLAVRVTMDGAEVAAGLLLEEPGVTVEVVRSFLQAHGATLAPGDRIIAGSLIAPLNLEPGDTVDVAFGPLGALAARFS
jgi:2-oxo-3-hexenedioate decarboxylase